MKKLLYGLLGLVVLVVVAAAVAVFVLPGAIDWRPRVEAAVKQATGRDLRIDGALHIALVPRIRVSAADVHLANAKGAATPDMVSIGSVALQAELWPLLHGRLVIDSLTVSKPVVHLAVDRQGRANWVFAGKPGGSAAGGGGSGGGGGMTVELHQARLDQGQISYADALTGQKVEARAITLTGGRSGGASRLDWKLGATVNGEPLAGSFSIDSLGKLQAGEPATIDMQLNGRHIAARYKGTATGGAEPGLDGVFDLDIPSVGQMFAWLDRKLPNDPGPLKLHIETTSAGGKLSLRNAALTGKAIRLTAKGTVDATRSPPRFDVSIDIPTADLDAYTPPPAPVPAQPAPAQPAPATAPAAGGWSDAPFDVSALGGADGHLAISLGTLKVKGLEISQGRFDITLEKKVLSLSKAALHLAGGSIEGTMRLDAAQKQPKLAATVRIAGVQARPLLEALAGSKRLGGAIAMDATIGSVGNSEKAMIGALAGKGTVNITDGAIYGINLAQSLRRMGTLGLGNPATEKTDFASLGGSFTISKGVLSNTDLSMLAPLLRLSGSGTVSLPPQTLDYRLEAKLVASLRGQGGSDALAGVPIPIRISGAWSAPQYGVDWKGVMQLDPSKLKDLPGNVGKIAPEVQKIVPGLKIPGGLFGK